MHSEGLLINKPALTGLLAVMHACLDFKNLILGKSHYLLYMLTLAMYPRMFMTLDTNLQPLAVCERDLLFKNELKTTTTTTTIFRGDNFHFS
jgi:26S proteasome regulatory subunit N1